MTIRTLRSALLRSSLGIALSLAAAGLLACSISYSSDSSSDSSKNSSDSSLKSSDSSSESTQKQNARFDQEVEQYTLAYVEAGGREDDAFLSGIGDLARQHGVSDWEAQTSTWEAIGRGLAHSPADRAARAAYQTAWTDGDAARESAVAKGLSSAQ